MAKKSNKLPESSYPYTDDWSIHETKFNKKYVPRAETLFALANGYLGMRGVFDEGVPTEENGTFLNGFYEDRPLVYGESAYGFPTVCESMLNVTDTKLIKLYVNGDFFDLSKAEIVEYNRYLDMKNATLNREVLWKSVDGNRIQVKSKRFVSYKRKHAAAIQYEVKVLDAPARLTLVSEIITPEGKKVNKEVDPRRAQGFSERVLHPAFQQNEDERIILCHQTASSGLTLAAGIDHVFESSSAFTKDQKLKEDSGCIIYSIDAQAGTTIKLTKYSAHHFEQDSDLREISFTAGLTLDRIKRRGFEQLLIDQEEYVQNFWKRSDVQIDSEDQTLQIATRWNLFQLLQSYARAEGYGIPAKGLTGEAYEGHYFWDLEIYILPFVIYSAPQTAQALLKYRYNTLDNARARAKELGHPGALFPWRTITGKESSAYYAAGTAQYHINADIAFSVKKYVQVTNDQEFLHEYGLEILIETARFWLDLGYYSDAHDDSFCINGVTGPDEYTAVVNNNYYTNVMAKDNLLFASASIKELQSSNPQKYEELSSSLNFNSKEADEWEKAGNAMFLPYDHELGIHPQDDDFVSKEQWDFENTPEDKYPLLLHFHPLNIYRHQVLKQADTVLAMFLMGNQFSLEDKKRNFQYYDALTTGDSSLSASIQSIMAAEIGDLDLALKYFDLSVKMDIEDMGNNMKDGAHIAATGGSWMAIVFGFGGMRDYNGNISFKPQLPNSWNRLQFSVTASSRLIQVEILPTHTNYLLVEGESFSIKHNEKVIELTQGEIAKV